MRALATAMAAGAIGSALALVWGSFRRGPMTVQLIPRLAIALAVAGVTAVAPAGLYAHAAQYSWSPNTLSVEAGITVILLSFGALGGRWWTLRHHSVRPVS